MIMGLAHLGCSKHRRAIDFRVRGDGVKSGRLWSGVPQKLKLLHLKALNFVAA